MTKRTVFRSSLAAVLAAAVVPSLVREIRDWLGRPPGQELLRRAVADGRVDLVRQALAQGADPKRFGYEEGPPLIAAVRAGRRELAQVLLDGGAEVDRASPQAGSVTALIVALEQGNPEMVQLLLAHGADPAQAGVTGAPLLFELVHDGSLPMLKLLLEAGAEVDLRDSSGRAWDAAVGSQLRSSRELAERFESMRGSQLSREPEALTGVTPLMLAARRDRVDVVEALLAAGADPNARDDAGATALVHAARSVWSKPACLAALLAAGADPSLADAEGRRPLDYAEDRELPRPDLAALLRTAAPR